MDFFLESKKTRFLENSWDSSVMERRNTDKITVKLVLNGLLRKTASINV